MSNTKWTPSVCNCEITIIGNGDEYVIDTPCEQHINLSTEDVLTDIRAKTAILNEEIQRIQEAEALVQEIIEEEI
jgi:hypothetical protein